MIRILRSVTIARWVLVWFALFTGAAIASPLIQPVSLQMVCSASGNMKLVSADGDSTQAVQAPGMDCPLCAGSLPPLALQGSLVKPSALAHALQPMAAAHIASITAPPLPSRGPPLI